MAKDPATLWYWNDWLTGTMTLSRHLKGCYMDLLGAQFNNGRLSLDEIKTVLGVDFNSWPTLSKKFKIDDKGLYYNEKAEETKNKRANYTKSRRQNLMGNHMENENENVIINKKFKIPTIQEVKDYCYSRGNKVNPEKWLAHYESNGWKVGKNPMKDWKAAIRTWENSAFDKKQESTMDALGRAYIEGKKKLGIEDE